MPSNSKKLILANADVTYFPNVFSIAESNGYLQKLKNRIKWKQENIRLFGRQYPTPRLSCWIGDESYRYSGLTHTPAPWPKELIPIRERVNKISDAYFNCVLLNLYRDGNDSMGCHADNEPELGINPIIASASFGASRRFRFKRQDKSQKTQTLVLESGSVLLMKGSTQKYWLHEIPKTKKIIGPRINLTFRRVSG